MLTDSNSLFKVIVKSSTTTERRLMIDVSATRAAYECCEINIVGWIKSTHNVADGLTKIKRCDTIKDLLDTEILNLSVEQ